MARGYKTGGRKAGEKDDPVGKLQKLAQKHAKAAIAELANQMKTAPEKAVRVSAANALLDRAYGKPTQATTTKVDANINVTLKGSDAKL
jgi:hypothetical protein